MARAILSLVLVAASITVGGISYSSGASAAGYCESVPPNKKVICCLNHPKAPACR